MFTANIFLRSTRTHPYDKGKASGLHDSSVQCDARQAEEALLITIAFAQS
jgi:hypothetical protein